MARARHLKTVFKDEPVKITGNDPLYTVTWNDKRMVVLKRYADGWYMPEQPGEHWLDADVASLGKLIDKVSF